MGGQNFGPFPPTRGVFRVFQVGGALQIQSGGGHLEKASRRRRLFYKKVGRHKKSGEAVRGIFQSRQWGGSGEALEKVPPHFWTFLKSAPPPTLGFGVPLPPHLKNPKYTPGYAMYS